MEIPDLPATNGRDGIGILNESSLHANLVKWFAEPGDLFEENINGYSIDILKENLLVEIQTRNFAQIQTKLLQLSKDHKIRLIYPIAENKWILKVNSRGEKITRRKSPKHGRVEDVFGELVRAWKIFTPNLSLWVAFILLEEVWVDDGKGSWRRKSWSIQDKHLLQVSGVTKFDSPSELLSLLPDLLPSPFTNSELADALKITSSLAGKMTYTLRKMDLLEIVGKRGKAHLHAINPRSSDL